MNIFVYKSLRSLICTDGSATVFTARVQLGTGSEDGPKQREGDGRTPEGRYHICSKNPLSKYHLSLGVSYPNEPDAQRGYEAGLIDSACLSRIISSAERPPWDTPLGGFIMIHGQPDSGARTGDWTAGCIALSNDDMDILYSMAAIGDAVVILP